ncbi:MAG: hypothetical protein WCW30_04975, partial [Candidatus Gracilibacteria bacterium]
PIESNDSFALPGRGADCDADCDLASLRTNNLVRHLLVESPDFDPKRTLLRDMVVQASGKEEKKDEAAYGEALLAAQQFDGLTFEGREIVVGDARNDQDAKFLQKLKVDQQSGPICAQWLRQRFVITQGGNIPAGANELFLKKLAAEEGGQEIIDRMHQLGFGLQLTRIGLVKSGLRGRRTVR